MWNTVLQSSCVRRCFRHRHHRRRLHHHRRLRQVTRPRARLLKPRRDQDRDFRRRFPHRPRRLQRKTTTKRSGLPILRTRLSRPHPRSLSRTTRPHPCRSYPHTTRRSLIPTLPFPLTTKHRLTLSSLHHHHFLFSRNLNPLSSFNNNRLVYDEDGRSRKETLYLRH